VKVEFFIVEGSMFSLKIALTTVSVATPATPSAGDVETIVKTDSPEAPCPPVLLSLHPTKRTMIERTAMNRIIPKILVVPIDTIPRANNR
jgi:hypothetical protein